MIYKIISDIKLPNEYSGVDCKQTIHLANSYLYLIQLHGSVQKKKVPTLCKKEKNEMLEGLI